jgi:hypothetical protein
MTIFVGHLSFNMPVARLCRPSASAVRSFGCLFSCGLVRLCESISGLILATTNDRRMREMIDGFHHLAWDDGCAPMT